MRPQNPVIQTYPQHTNLLMKMNASTKKSLGTTHRSTDLPYSTTTKAFNQSVFVYKTPQPTPSGPYYQPRTSEHQPHHW